MGRFTRSFRGAVKGAGFGGLSGGKRRGVVPGSAQVQALPIHTLGKWGRRVRGAPVLAGQLLPAALTLSPPTLLSHR